VVLGCQVRTEQPNGGEVDLAGGEKVEDHGKAPGRPGSLHPVIGLVLGEGGTSTVDEEGE
jgi:hypothetical protein